MMKRLAGRGGNLTSAEILGVAVGDLNSLKQQDCCGTEFGENRARMANVSAPPPGVTCPQGMLTRGNTTAQLLPKEDIFRIPGSDLG